MGAGGAQRGLDLNGVRVGARTRGHGVGKVWGLVVRSW